MDSVLRKLGLKKSDNKETEARKRLQKELFAFNKNLQHGFPSKPSAIAHDPKLGFLAIGTSSGSLRVYGRPGVQFSGQLDSDSPIHKIYFLPEQARLVTIAGESTISMWEMNVIGGETKLDQIKTFKFDSGNEKIVSVSCLTSKSDELLLSSTDGIVNILNIETFALSEKVIKLDDIVQIAAYDLRANRGQLISIVQHPTMPEKFLFGFGQGIIILWNTKEEKAEHLYTSSQQLEAVVFNRDGSEFLAAHSDGSYVTWKTSDSSKPTENATTPYGPFPCKEITKIDWKTSSSGQFVIFSGGMPTATYSDRNTVSVINGTKHVVFDMAAKVVDFVVLSSSNEKGSDSSTVDDPHTVVIVTEEELICVDLTSDQWPLYNAPYLSGLHSNVVSCMTVVENVPESLHSKIESAGKSYNSRYSTKEWPINGGKTEDVESQTRDVLITGHEDGTVIFWDASITGIKLMYKLSTAELFGLDACSKESEAGNQETEDGWPPFRKVGESSSDVEDVRLAIHKIEFCPTNELLVLAGGAGQVIFTKFSSEEKEVTITTTGVTLVEIRHSSEALPSKTDAVKCAPGFHPTGILQITPPQTCTALALQSEWQLAAVGTSCGFVLYDYLKLKSVFTKGAAPPTGAKLSVSRSRSFQQSLRESFRSLRKKSVDGRPKSEAKRSESKEGDVASHGEAAVTKSESAGDVVKPSNAEDVKSPSGEGEESTPKPDILESEVKPTSDPAETSGSVPEATKPDVVEKKEESSSEVALPEGKSTEASETPAEKIPEPDASAVAEANPATDEEATGKLEDDKPKESTVTFGSTPVKSDSLDGSRDIPTSCMVRSLYFTQTFISHTHNTLTPTLWVGTNHGEVLIHQLVVPSGEHRSEEDVTCTLAKEIHLKHGAAVINMFVIDRNNQPIDPVANERSKPADMTGGHKVVVCSQEQFKIFTLPNLKAHNKYKLFHHHEEGAVQNVSLVVFASKSDEAYVENNLVCMTSRGDVKIVSIPQLRLQMNSSLFRPDYEEGTSGPCVFSSSGLGFFRSAPKELDRFSVSAHNLGRPTSSLDLKEGMRPVPVEPVVPEPAVEEVVASPAPNEAKTEDSETPKEEKTEVEKTEVSPVVDSEVQNESCVAGDVTGDITADSIKEHLTEEEIITTTTRDVIENDKVITTTIHSITDSEGNCRESSKTVIEETTSKVDPTVHDTKAVTIIESH